MSYVSSKDGQKSSMRLNFITLTMCSALILLSVVFHIIFMTLKCSTIEWIGVGALTLGVLAGMSGMGYVKAHQKQFENDK